MKFIMLLILSLFFVWNSFSYYFIDNTYSNLVDKCCIVDLINYKENLKETKAIMQAKYPTLKRKIDYYIKQLQEVINQNPRFKQNKLKLYGTIIKRVQDYIYMHNIMKPRPSYYSLAYFILRVKDLYEYERNKKEYDLEASLENLDKEYGYGLNN